MASKGVNKVIVMGNLGNDPEMRALPNGGSVANLTIATGESWRDKQTGEQREKTEWHRVAIFGKLAEVAQQYLKKGSQVYIEGQLQTRKWQDQNGQDRYTTEIVVQGFNGVMQMIGSRQGGQQAAPSQDGYNQAHQQQTPNKNTQQPARQPDPNPQQGFNHPPSDFDDDIPF